MSAGSFHHIDFARPHGLMPALPVMGLWIGIELLELLLGAGSLEK